MIKTIQIFITFYSLCALPAWAAQLQINTQTGKKGDNVTFTVFIHNAPTTVDSFGFEISYDPTCMIYQSLERGSLITRGFQFFQASNVQFGRVRIGGIETGDNKIVKGDSGSLLRVAFNVIGDNNSTVNLISLKDDFKTWSTQQGQMIVQQDETDETDDTSETDDTTSTDEATQTDNMAESNILDNATNASETSSGNQTQAISGSISNQDISYNSVNTHSANANDSIVSNYSSSPKSEQTIHQQNSQPWQRTSGVEIQAGNVHHQAKKQQKDSAGQNSTIPNRSTRNVPIETDRQKFQKTPFMPQHVEWGNVQPKQFSGSPQQSAGITQKHIYTFPSFLTGTIVLSLIVQMGILIILIFIYQKLHSNSKRR
ncbi:MAG: cellulosome anchoring protein [Candidatus Magnetoglobus multicellularis str. Araruama]|uniref:Cellulosome anchoring protein n=1 Tax=Candidatus Magnetoglobus multicellularis str. Araruama TaxID=890399 RepID=A0A1V1P9E7_9BACT|nr:MAG: cellulosome anchoring protein [Candidatus Magnetoglobus multicellularis str. Araruama]